MTTAKRGKDEQRVYDAAYARLWRMMRNVIRKYEVGELLSVEFEEARDSEKQASEYRLWVMALNETTYCWSAMKADELPADDFVTSMAGGVETPKHPVEYMMEMTPRGTMCYMNPAYSGKPVDWSLSPNQISTPDMRSLKCL